MSIKHLELKRDYTHLRYQMMTELGRLERLHRESGGALKTFNKRHTKQLKKLLDKMRALKFEPVSFKLSEIETVLEDTFNLESINSLWRLTFEAGLLVEIHKPGESTNE